MDNFIRRARVLRIIDGDTFRAEIDLGYTVKIEDDVRIYGYNSPDAGKKGKTQADEDAAGLALGRLIPIGTYVYIQSQKNKGSKKEKYGRWLRKVWREDDPEQKSIGLQMVALGYGEPEFYGEKPIAELL